MFDELKFLVEQLEKINEELKAENEELEKELRQKRMTILMNNDHYFEVDKTNRKLKQALTEIKEIADTDKCNNCKNINEECFECANERLTKILNKISEVENEKTQRF